MSLQEIIRRERKVKRACEVLATKYFPKSEFEIKSVDGYIDSKGRSHCLIDFKKRNFEPFDCDEYCDRVSYDEEEYKGCLETWMLPDGTVVEATVAGDCNPVWSDEWEDVEEFEKRQKEFHEKWEKVGCEISDGWIHPHELIGGAEWEEYPATCWFHPSAKSEGACRIDKVLDIMKEVW